MKRIGVVTILVMAFFGLADSAYLAEHEASGTPLICNIQNLSGCNIVAASEYSRILGIPTAQFGVLFYGMLFVVAAIELALFNQALRRVIQGLAVIGLLASLFSTFVQIFYIHAECVYCLLSALISVVIFLIASFLEPIIVKKTVEIAKSSSLTTASEMLSMPPAL